MPYLGEGGKFESIVRQLEADGFRLEFSCTHGEEIPSELGFTGRENGWEIRRKIKEWCLLHHLDDYQIVRNTSWVKDLHGVVYELWVKRPTVPG